MNGLKCNIQIINVFKLLLFRWMWELGAENTSTVFIISCTMHCTLNMDTICNPNGFGRMKWIGKSSSNILLCQGILQWITKLILIVWVLISFSKWVKMTKLSFFWLRDITLSLTICPIYNSTQIALITQSISISAQKSQKKH